MCKPFPPPISEATLSSVAVLKHDGNPGKNFGIDGATVASLNALGLPNPGLDF